MADRDGLAGLVRAAWQAAMHSEEVAEDVRFLSAGGHSLAAARLVARLRDTTGVQLPLSCILRDDPTLPDLIRLVREGGGTTGPPARPAPALPGTGRTEPRSAPLGPNLRRIWAWHRIHPDSPAYNVVRVVEIAGRLQPAALRAALDDLAHRHEALRCAVDDTTITEPRLTVGAAVPPGLTIELINDRDLAEHELPARTDPAIRRVADQVFDLRRAPLWRAGLLYAPARDRSWLILVFHHMIADLRASDLVLADLARAYQARREGRAPGSGVPAPSLLSHLAYEQSLVDTPRWQEQLEWWRAELMGIGAPAPMPFGDRDAPASFAGDVQSYTLPAARSREIDRAVSAVGVTVAQLFLACAAGAVSAWTGGGRPEVLGVPSVRVSRPEDEQLVGFLLDTLVLPVTVDPEAGLAEVCEAVRERFLAAVEHALPPFDRVVDALGLPRSGARSPLVRVWFNDLTRAACPRRFGDAASAEYGLPPAWALFDIGLYLADSPEGYRLDLVTRAGLLPPAEAATLLRQIVALAVSAIQGGRVPVGALLADRTVTEVGPATVRPGARTTADLVADHARHSPDATAIVDGNGPLSYADLDRAVDHAARSLRAVTIPGTVVGVAARRDRGYIVELLACGRAGVTAALIDTAWPARRRVAAARAAAATHEFTSLGEVRPLPGDPDRTGPAPDPDGISHVLFTSGTTGRPLAVRVGRGQAEAALDDLAAMFGLTGADRTSLLSGAAHDPALRDIGLALRAGGTVCVPPAAIVGDPRAIAGWVRAAGVTVVSATPALLGLAFGLDPAPLPAVRLVISGGAPLTAVVAGLVRAAAPHATLVNGYGTTETPQLVTAGVFDPADPVPAVAQLPVGTPLAGRRVEVRDRQGRRRGAGQLGSVWVAEPYIAHGYADGGDHGRFAADDDGVRWCRTGDLARRDTMGRLWLAGRTDRQALVNGYRFTLDEVEHTTRRVPGVADALCELVTGPDGDGLRLWVVPAPGAAVGEDDVRARLSAVLPAPIATARIFLTDRPRLSANLKLRPGPPDGTPDAEGSPAAQEAQILSVVEAVAGHPVDPTGNLFDIGFTSLSLLQLGAELSESLGRPVPVLDLFRYPTVRAFAANTPAGPAGAGAAPPGSATPTEPAGTAHRLARMRTARQRAIARSGTDQAPEPVRPAPG